MSTIERAIALAAVAHAGATDKAGDPYILHVLRVMLRVRGSASRIAAALHDVVEDTPITPPQLRELGFDAEVVDAVAALTKRQDAEEDYFAFVERAARNDVARPVKLADIEDNLDLSRIPEPTERDRARIARYRRARKLIHLVARAHGDATPYAPTMMPLRRVITPDALTTECPGDRPIYACDFYVEGAERGEEEVGGLRLGRVLSVDHHAPIERMRAPITSTRLACDHLRVNGRPAREPWVVVNHTDCDSVLSSAMLMGYVAPHLDLVAASVCADHTGEEHPVADLLQALDEGRHGDRTEEQYLESLRNLRLLLEGRGLEEPAADAVGRRRARRDAARQLVERGTVRLDGALATGTLDVEIDGAFFPALLPGAAVIMLASPHPRAAGRWAVKLRLGSAAPSGLTLHALGLDDFDPAFGGRWNAGSDKRGGGTPLPPAEYALRLRARLDKVLASAS